MAGLSRAIMEVLILGAVGIVLGAGANAVRGSGSLRWTKNYFQTREPIRNATPAPAESDVEKSAVSPAQSSDKEAMSQGTTATSGDASQSKEADVPEAEEAANETAKSFEHPYQSASLSMVIDVLNDPATDAGLNVFVDARSQAAYEDGHIPGAVRCYHYEAESCIDRVMEYALPADKVIVYCNGGDCTDSRFMCDELLMAGLEMQQLWLFEGGWHEWKSSGQPIVTGPTRW